MGYATDAQWHPVDTTSIRWGNLLFPSSPEFVGYDRVSQIVAASLRVADARHKVGHANSAVEEVAALTALDEAIDELDKALAPFQKKQESKQCQSPAPTTFHS